MSRDLEYNQHNFENSIREKEKKLDKDFDSLINRYN